MFPEVASLECQNTTLNIIKGIRTGCISDAARATGAIQEQTRVCTGRETVKHAAHRGPLTQPVIYYFPPLMMSYSYFYLNSHSCP